MPRNDIAGVAKVWTSAGRAVAKRRAVDAL